MWGSGGAFRGSDDLRPHSRRAHGFASTLAGVVAGHAMELARECVGGGGGILAVGGVVSL